MGDCLSAFMTLVIILLHTFWGIVFFDGCEKKNWYALLVVLLTHLLVSALVSIATAQTVLWSSSPHVSDGSFHSKWNTCSWENEEIQKNCLKQWMNTWLVWLSGLSAGLWIQRLLVQSPVRAQTWAAGQVAGWGCARGNHIVLFLSLSPSLPLSLKINK